MGRPVFNEQKTDKVEWASWSWNPVVGCEHDCSYCYARKLAEGRLKPRYTANSNLPTHDEPDHEAHHNDPFYPRFWESRLYDPVHYNRAGIIDYESSKGIFVCNMGELFGDWVPPTWQEKIFQIIDYCPNDRFYLLTKQPQNLIKFSPFPDNCWVGVSAWNEASFIEACQELHYIQAKIKYISIEPLLKWFEGFIKLGVDYWLEYGGIGWSIIGSQTKPTVLPKREWVTEIAGAARKAGIPIFLKDNLVKGLGIPLPSQEMPK